MKSNIERNGTAAVATMTLKVAKGLKEQSEAILKDLPIELAGELGLEYGRGLVEHGLTDVAGLEDLLAYLDGPNGFPGGGSAVEKEYMWGLAHAIVSLDKDMRRAYIDLMAENGCNQAAGFDKYGVPLYRKADVMKVGAKPVLTLHGQPFNR